MKQYLDALRDVQDNGRGKADRTGTGTRAVFGRQLRFNLTDGFPLLTTKKMFTRGIIAELLWILSGDTNEHTLREQNVNIWKEWVPKGRELTAEERCSLYLYNDGFTHEALDKLGVPRHAEESGELGRVYGAQWRSWRSVVEGGAIPLSTRVAMHVAKNEGGAQELMSLKHRAATHPDGEHGVPKDLYAEMCDQGGIPRRFVEIKTVDQITNLIRDLKANPTSRRHLVTAWNPGELDQMALPPCHLLFQFYCEELTVAERRKWMDKQGRLYSRSSLDDLQHDFLDHDRVPRYRLSCQLYQRSADIFLGVPFNIASYSLLTMMVSQCVNMVPGEFIHTFGDLHIYSDHVEQVTLQLTREPRLLPKMKINPEVKDIFAFKVEDFELIGYDPHPQIKAEVSV